MNKFRLFFAFSLFALAANAQIDPTKPLETPVATPTTADAPTQAVIATPSEIPVVATPAPLIVPPIIGEGCPYYKVKITLNSGQIFSGLITSEDCGKLDTMSDENLMKQIKTVKKAQENSIEMLTQYFQMNVLGHDLFYYETLSVIKLQKIEIKSAVVVEKSHFYDGSKFSDYMGSKRLVTLMRHQPPVSIVEINFSDDDCEVKTSYILVNYHPKVNEIDLRTFAEKNKSTFIVDCDETDNDARIKKLLEPLNIVYFKEDTN